MPAVTAGGSSIELAAEILNGIFLPVKSLMLIFFELISVGFSPSNENLFPERRGLGYNVTDVL